MTVRSSEKRSSGRKSRRSSIRHGTAWNRYMKKHIPDIKKEHPQLTLPETVKKAAEMYRRDQNDVEKKRRAHDEIKHEHDSKQKSSQSYEQPMKMDDNNNEEESYE